MVQDDEEHGYGAEEERKLVQLRIGYHGWSGKGASRVDISGLTRELGDAGEMGDGAESEI